MGSTWGPLRAQALRPHESLGEPDLPLDLDQEAVNVYALVACGDVDVFSLLQRERLALRAVSLRNKSIGHRFRVAGGLSPPSSEAQSIERQEQ